MNERECAAASRLLAAFSISIALGSRSGLGGVAGGFLLRVFLFADGGLLWEFAAPAAVERASNNTSNFLPKTFYWMIIATPLPMLQACCSSPR